MLDLPNWYIMLFQHLEYVLTFNFAEDIFYQEIPLKTALHIDN